MTRSAPVASTTPSNRKNRLVARTLERQWEAGLAAEATVQAEYARFLAQQPVPLSGQEREAIRRLAADIPALWQAPTTTAADHQAIIRQLVERAVVTWTARRSTWLDPLLGGRAYFGSHLDRPSHGWSS